MTREEVLKNIRNHSSEIKVCMATLDYMLVSIVAGYRQEGGEDIGGLKNMMDSVKGKIDGIKSALGEWPE